MNDVKVKICVSEEGTLTTETFNEYTALCEKHGITAVNTVPKGYWEPDSYERHILRTVFNSTKKLTEYKENIPLRVLQELDVAKERNLHPYYYILYPDVNPDPILVGSDQESYYSVASNPYTIIAQWGSHIPTFKEIEERAIALTKIRVLEYKMKLEGAILNLSHDIDAVVKASLHGKNPDTVYF